MFSDGEDSEEEQVGSSLNGDPLSSTNVKGSQQRQRAKRQKTTGWSNDWVVKAFSSSRHHGKSPATTGNSDSGEASSSIHSLWNTVGRSAILDAARESRTAEQRITAQKGKRRIPAALGSSGSGNNLDNEPNKNDRNESAESAGGRSSNGASTMFQSVMTRVGSGNGRIFGAYPNDAPPVHACAHKRGVVQLARRYGYGDWRTAEADYDDECDGELVVMDDGGGTEDGEQMWGGGDLVLGGMDSDGVEGSADLIASSQARKQTSKRGRKRRQRRKKKQPLK